ncbi:integral membrane transport protein [Rhodococcus wratislaviensis]|uniref:Putative proline/betaine transporter n=1 Tax=Rhodococcus wratislaviensis TaxID=44752 RepID=A0A402CC09_RHOWR|nr:MFS transporter [Rhodococcus wratislaviensis]GCE41162.1 integral membrane transport protein [Rhodococcus wratislaviensis]
MSNTTSSTPGTATVLDLKKSRRALVAGSLGNLIEWYEFAIYAYMAPIIAPLFFPSENPTASILSTFLLFALAFFLRPIGAVVFGRMTDRIGRKPVLALIIGLMTVATTCIGLLPTHETIGVLAPLLLTLCRIGQGLSAGGEMGGAVSLMVESAPANKRGVYGSWSFVGTTLGFVLGGGVATLLAVLLSEDAMSSWGWRIGFLLAAPMGIIVFYLRMKVDETPHFKQVKVEQDGAADVVDTTAARRPLAYLLTTLGVVVVYNAVGNTFMVGMPTFLSTSFDMSFERSYFLALVTGLAAGLTMPLFGALSDRVGRRPVLLVGSILVVVLSYPLYYMLKLGFGGGLIALVIAGVLIGVVGGPMPAFLSERFRTRNRATGVSVTYALSVALFGGTAPYIITWLASATGDPLSAAYYTLGCAAISVIALLTIRGAQLHQHREELEL